jgi:hypothetical protein
MKALNARHDAVRLLPLEHDFWICKRPNPQPVPQNWNMPILPDFQPWSIQRWEPPESWRAWPTFSAGSDTWLDGLGPRTTRYVDGATGIARTGDANDERAGAIRILQTLCSEPRSSLAAVIGVQVTCWVDAALGRLGRIVSNAVADIDPNVLIDDLSRNVIAHRSDLQHEALHRKYDFAVIADPMQLRGDMMEDCLDRLYSTVFTSNVSVPEYETSYRGQSSEWREYFRALGADLTREQALASVQLAALVLRSDSIWRALGAIRVAAVDDLGLRDFVTCVRRRWHMALECLAWLEVSLQRTEPFHLLAPADLACFAVTAVLPTYPRAQMVISHRGRDVKQPLATSCLWGSNEILIDAMFRPEWQNNRAMVWSLFSSTPVICKLKSANYNGSKWCRREAEMFEHLLESSDFLDGRRYVEVELTRIAALEPAARSWSKVSRFFDMPSGMDSPPFEFHRWPAWQGALIRAASVVRFIYRFLLLSDRVAEDRCAEYTAHFIAMLLDEWSSFDDVSMFGFDQFWQRLSRELRADAALLELAGPLATIRKDAACNAREAESWFERHMVSVGNGNHEDLDVCDLFAALDWRDVLEGYLRRHNNNGMFENQAGFIDLRGATLDEWRGDLGWTVARGLLYLRLPYPLLIRQLADQGVENWPGPCAIDSPIYTEHLEGQSVPQSEVFFSLQGAWPAFYHQAVSGEVELCPELAYACSNSRKAGADPVFVRYERRDESFESWLREKKAEEQSSNSKDSDEA